MKENENEAPLQEISKAVRYVLAGNFKPKLETYMNGVAKRNIEQSTILAESLHSLVKSWQPKLIPDFDLVSVYKDFRVQQEKTLQLKARSKKIYEIRQEIPEGTLEENIPEDILMRLEEAYEITEDMKSRLDKSSIITEDMKSYLEQANKQYKLYNAILQIKMLDELQGLYSKDYVLTSEDKDKDIQKYFISCLKQQSYFSKPENSAAAVDIDEKNEALSLINNEINLDQIFESFDTGFYDHIQKHINFHDDHFSAWSQNKLSELDEYIIKILPTKLLVEMFISTKEAVLFSENKSQSKFTLAEESILGDIIFSIEALAYDNGVHHEENGAKIITHDQPLPVHMVFVPGAVLANNGHADYRELVDQYGDINYDLFQQFYIRKLSAAFMEINNKGKPVVVTVPTIGGGEFAGRFGEVGQLFHIALEETLRQHASTLTNIKGVVFDPNASGMPNEERQIEHMKFLVIDGNYGLTSSQLCSPEQYHKDFSGCTLATLVAADSKSLPGNDFWGNKRATDEGVKAAATNVMQVLTGLANCDYDKSLHKFLPSKKLIGFESQEWGRVFERAKKYTQALLSGDDMKGLSNDIEEVLHEEKKIVLTTGQQQVTDVAQPQVEVITTKQQVSDIGQSKDEVTTSQPQVEVSTSQPQVEADALDQSFLSEASNDDKEKNANLDGPGPVLPEVIQQVEVSTSQPQVEADVLDQSFLSKASNDDKEKNANLDGPGPVLPEVIQQVEVSTSQPQVEADVLDQSFLSEVSDDDKEENTNLDGPGVSVFFVEGAKEEGAEDISSHSVLPIEENKIDDEILKKARESVQKIQKGKRPMAKEMDDVAGSRDMPRSTAVFEERSGFNSRFPSR
jgi:hypothetical protein